MVPPELPPLLVVLLPPPPPDDDDELDELPHALNATTDASARRVVHNDLLCLVNCIPPLRRCGPARKLARHRHSGLTSLLLLIKAQHHGRALDIVRSLHASFRRTAPMGGA